MRHAFDARLIHDRFGDPGLYVDLALSGRALLFDLPPLVPLSPGELLKPDLVCVSHAHMDHFSGFDELLRVRFGRPETLSFLGPARLAERVAGKLAGFEWNLVDAENPFRIQVLEVESGRVCRTLFRAATGFAAESHGEGECSDGVAWPAENWRLRTVELDHAIPCLAFALEESQRLNVNPSALAGMGLEAGPWLSELKTLVRRGAAPETPVSAQAQGGALRELELAELSQQVLMRARGERLVYVTDAAPTADNGRRIVELAAGADLFFCEAAFLERDRERAQATRHLTAADCGRLARQAGVRQLMPFHFSRRYRSDAAELLAEASAAFGQRIE
jgi:ribonuclease Z